MKILIIGVSGFIGKHLYHLLSQHGHQVFGCSRHRVSGISNWLVCDINQSEQTWERIAQGMDVVINAVGIFQQTDKQTFSQIHHVGPTRLFDICRKNGIRVIQISAIGAEQENPTTDFLKSKRLADQYLLRSNLPNIVLYPGIVLGEQGETTRQLTTLSRLFLVPIIFNKNTKLPLISIHQLGEKILELINEWPKSKQTAVLIGENELIEETLNNLRRWMGLRRGCYFYIPSNMTKLFFKIFPKLTLGSLNRESIDMLSAYSDKKYMPATNETATDSLLKTAPKENFLIDVKYQLLFYFNIFFLSLIWISSGIVSVVNIETSRELIALAGVGENFGDIVIVGGAITDIMLGILMWFSKLRRWVIYLQIGVMFIYSIIISLLLPIYWLHPFAPVIKNIAVLMMALYLLAEEKGKKHV